MRRKREEGITMLQTRQARRERCWEGRTWEVGRLPDIVGVVVWRSRGSVEGLILCFCNVESSWEIMSKE